MHDASSGILPEETALEWCQEWLRQGEGAAWPNRPDYDGGFFRPICCIRRDRTASSFAISALNSSAPQERRPHRELSLPSA